MIKDYEYKKEVHKLWKWFISGNLNVPRKKMSALCLPSKYAREVENTYYRAGMLPENIVGVEQDKEAADFLKKSQEFQVEHCNLLDYVKMTNRKFHIISLDYAGHLGDEEIMKACNLSKQQLGARKAWITMRQT